jgi:UDP-N-acetyl-D-mannosaminuronate dehydrogenase
MQAAFSRLLHSPSIGVGGHCIPVNPYFLLEKAEEQGVDLRMMRLARKINDNMYTHSVRLVSEALRACGKKLRRSNVALLGVSFRANVKETRLSVVKTVNNALPRKAFLSRPRFIVDDQPRVTMAFQALRRLRTRTASNHCRADNSNP